MQTESTGYATSLAYVIPPSSCNAVRCVHKWHVCINGMCAKYGKFDRQVSVIHNL